MRVLKKDIEPLLRLLEKVEIPMNYDRGRTKDATKTHGSNQPAGNGRSVLFGPSRYTNKLTKMTIAHPDIYKEAQTLGHKYAPFPVKNFMLNKNYVTKPHTDGKNIGESVIFSFGDYEGGELVVKDKIVNTKMNTHRMDGSFQLHWNKPITRGTKYSLIFFNIMT